MEWLPKGKWSRRVTIGSMVLLVPAMALSNYMEKRLDARIEERDRAEEARVRAEEEARISEFLAARDKDGKATELLAQLREKDA